MIEEAALPDRRCSRWCNLLAEILFEHGDPKLEIVWSANEKVHVIGHDYVSTQTAML